MNTNVLAKHLSIGETLHASKYAKFDSRQPYDTIHFLFTTNYPNQIVEKLTCTIAVINDTKWQFRNGNKP